MTPEERAEAVFARWKAKGSDTNPWGDLIEMIASAIQDAEARGYRAAQEQAAEVADAAAQAPRNGDAYLCALECISEIRTAIRAMKPKETGDE